MKQTTKRFLSMIMGIVFFVGSIVLYFEFAVPAYNETVELKGQKLSLQNSLEIEKSAVTKVLELVQKYRTRDQEVQRKVSLVLPLEPDIPGAIAQLYGLSQNNNLTLSAISVALAGISNVPQDSSKSQLQAALQRPVGTLTLSTSLTGSYEDFKAFLAQLQTNIRIFDLKSMNLSTVRKTVAGRTTDEVEGYKFDIVVTTYYQTP